MQKAGVAAHGSLIGIDRYAERGCVECNPLEPIPRADQTTPGATDSGN
jgi:hypothetical protein